MKKILLILVAAIFGLLFLQTTAAQSDETLFTYYETDCSFFNSGTYTIDCGYVTMPEDHDAPDESNMIRLAVSIIRSPNPDKRPDPVLYLDGGPGGRSAGFAPAMPLRQPFMNLILQNRDLILVDQRGMGISEPTLYCTPFRSPSDAFDATLTGDVWIERMRDCPDTFAEQGIDWTKYTTRQNALDLSMIPAALGYEQVNLFGLSYGTILGLIILRDNPAYVRSALLDAVLSPTAQPFEDSARNFYEAFGQLEADCQADIVCRLAYPNLREMMENTYDRLQQQPDVFYFEDNKITITADFFASRVRYTLADPNAVNTLPAFIMAVSEQDYDVLEPFIEGVFNTEMEHLPNQALFVTMVCPDGAYHSSVEAIEVASAGYHPIYQDGFNAESYRQCEVWGDILPFDDTLPESDIPALMMVGRYDPATPPALANEAAQGLSHSQVVELPYGSHGATYNPCGQQIALQFFNDPVQELDTSCISETHIPHFVLMTTVTRRPLQALTGITSIAAMFGLTLLVTALLRRMFGVAWWASFRRVGWIAVAVTLVIVIGFTINRTFLLNNTDSLTVTQVIMPLVMAMYSAAVFSPAGEPGLEIHLSTSRPLSWLILERLAVIVITFVAIGSVGAVISLGQAAQPALIVLVGWIPSALFLSAIGFYVSVRSRVLIFGVVVSIFLWMAFGGFGDFFVPGVAFGAPLNLIQPFLWILHLFPSLDDFILRDYWLNRVFQTTASIVIIMLTLRELREPENILLDTANTGSRRNSRNKVNSLPRHITISPNISSANGHKPALSIHAVSVRIAPLRVIAGIAWTEFKMHWRKRGVKVLMFVGLAGIVLGVLFLNGAMATLQMGYSVSTLTAQDMQVVRGEALLYFSIGLILLALFLLPLVLADSVPTDHEYDVAELLAAAPVPDAIYLAGKMAGAVLAALSVLASNAVIYLVLWRLRHGAFYALPFIDLTIILALMTTLVTGFTVLVGATQHATRRALMIALVLVALPELVQSLPLLNVLLPSRMMILTNAIDASLENLMSLPLISRQMTFYSPIMLRLYLFAALQLAITYAAVLAWRRHR